MVFTAAQTTQFFTNDAQMALPNRTFQKLAGEGITTPDDLIDFYPEAIKQITENLRRPHTRDPDPNPNAPVGATIPTPPFIIGAKSQMRLTAAAHLGRYYDTIGRPLTAASMQW